MLCIRMNAKLLAALLPLTLLVPAAQAGSADEPEILDAADDAGRPELDVQKVWVDGDDPDQVVFHLVTGAALPALPRETDACADPGCAFAALSFRIEFRVLAPDGTPAPQTAGYNRSYIVYRHGPADESLRSAIGVFDDEGVLTLNGTVAVTVAENEIVFAVSRDNPALAIPHGAEPGAYRINQTYAYSSPQICFPAQEVPQVGTVTCAPLLKPAPDAPPTTAAQWDRAPDAGFGTDFVFPAPPPKAAPAKPSLQATTSTQGPTTVTVTSTTTTTIVAAPEPQPVPADGDLRSDAERYRDSALANQKDAPGLGVGLLLAIGLLALARRRVQ